MIMIPAPLATGHDHRRGSGATSGPVDADDPVMASPVRADCAAAMLRASSSGSGRSISHSTRPADAYAAAASRNGPASGGNPSSLASVPVRLTRLGPTMAPTAV